MAVLAMMIATGAPWAGEASAQSRAPNPSANGAPQMLLMPGEQLHYQGDFGVFGKVGTGTMSVSTPRCHEGRAVVQLDFSFRGRVMLMSISDRTRSIVELEHGRSLFYEKDERHPMGTREERVMIMPEAGAWEPAGGVARRLHTDRPLDELSFLYLARSVQLAEGEMREFDRHFDPERNPVRLRDRGTARIRVPAGTFDTRVVEMEVTDPTRFGEAGRVVLHLTDDQARVPVKITSAMPVVGSLVLVLESMQPGSSSARPPVC
jgi:hypothetical protein